MRGASALSTFAIALLAASCSPEAADHDAGAQNGANVAGPADAAGTNEAASKAGAPAQAAAARLAVEGEGLRWLQPGGTGEAIPFGTRQAAVLASLERLRGRAEQGTNEDCPTGPVQYASWPDGLSLVFQQDLFVGWTLSEGASGAVETARGIGPGDTRAQLDAAHAPEVRQGTLGTEFGAGDIYGVLDGPSASARITDMSAGMTCIAS
jgi:hypothetical protein